MAEDIITKVRLQMRRNVTEYWRLNPQFVPLPGEIIVYTDYQIVGGRFVPAIKIGDGQTAVVSLPFVLGSAIDDDILRELNAHEDDTTKHVTQEERQFWNRKLNYRMEGETLVFTTE